MKKSLFFLVHLALSVSLLAQNVAGSGNVSSDAGVMLSNAIVRISPSSDTSIVYEYVCDKNGNYSFDFGGESMEYIFNIFPSTQTLQFTHITEIMGSGGLTMMKQC